MAAALPAKLKIKEITPFVARAAQLEKFRPIVSYWCYYYVVDQILSKGLHTEDEECMTYTTTMMDKLEEMKTEQAGNDAITDDVAAKAYIEQFALETFKKGDDAIHSDKASKQTIDTFHAAATFFDLLNMSIWAPADPEMAAKAKYAKYHAVRIAKAIKAGEDPNATNPKDREPEDEAPSSIAYQQPSVESAPDSMQPSPPLPGAGVLPIAPVGPSPAEQSQTSRSASVGGGYFPAPNVPTFTSDNAAPAMPTADSNMDMGSPPVSFPTPGVSGLPSAPPPADLASPAAYYTQQPAPPPAVPAYQPPAPVAAPTYAAAPAGGYRTDDDAVAQATKHAKWAISALNFEDVNTAVKELRIALQSLGAS